MQPFTAPMIESRTVSETKVPPIGPIVRVARSAPTRSVAAICGDGHDFQVGDIGGDIQDPTAAIPITSERSRFFCGSRTSPATKLT